MSEESGIRIRTEDGSELPALTEPVLDELFDGAARREPHLEVARGPDEWITARLLPGEMFRLTHRCGPDADEFELYTGDAIMLRDILFAWIDRDPWWCERVVWSRVDPAVAELEAVRGELADLLDGFDVVELMTGALDDALTRADALLADAETPSVTEFADSGRSAELGEIERSTPTGMLPTGRHERSGSDAAMLDNAACDTSDPFARLDALLAVDPAAFESSGAETVESSALEPDVRRIAAERAGSTDWESADFDAGDPFARLDALLALDPETYESVGREYDDRESAGRGSADRESDDREG
ncbi:hypothetical protein [Nocardia bovistercoris]|uniref:Uncharacterized protein n=1 Tax=Nocardia bovistercoris TaxID=2785916 RepID=A0A931IAR9_9NOCA|nr:hypothetical protein [Nocardia bovistercoris]MBH0776418.1 hypothetical protein [Nocardia bovistercoris]